MVVSALIFALGLLGLATTSDANNCRVFPDDKAWPSEKDWNALNKTVSGRLVATVPPATIPTTMLSSAHFCRKIGEIRRCSIYSLVLCYS